MKGDKEDIERTGDDIDLVIVRHPDAMQGNPDLAAETMKLREKWQRRYEEITGEKPKS